MNLIRTIARRLTRGLTALCLLLELAVLVLWVRSYRVQDSVSWGGWYARSADFADVGEERGWLRAGRGELQGWRSTQRIDGLPGEVGRELVRDHGFGGTRVESGPVGDGNNYAAPTLDTTWRRLGFYYETRPGRSPTTRYHEAGAPLWALFVALILLPSIRLNLWMRRRRLRQQRQTPFACPNCGYDCRATPGRCPECGAERGEQNSKSETRRTNE
jgi:hypothetical protein